MTKKQKKMLFRIILSAILTVPLHFLQVNGLLRFFLYLVPYFIIGYDVLKKAFKGIIRGRVFDENFLMAIATVGALVLGVTVSGDYAEAVAVMLFYQVGEFFQSYAVGKSRKNIGALMNIRPDYANLEKDGQLSRVNPDEVEIGSIIAVKPGEKIPIDGIVIFGNTLLNASALTGESLPKQVGIGDEVISGCINLNGLIKIRTSKVFSESTVSKILELTENASSRKSKSEAFISKFAKVYTPIVCYSALAVALIPPIITLILNGSLTFTVWLYRALSFLVASCPCALVVSIPLSFFAGLGGAGSKGILIKGSNYLEALSKTECVVFDKTGTLTEGVFEVAKIESLKVHPNELLEYSALAESFSSHPIALSLISAYGKSPDKSRVSSLEELSGHGVIATVDRKNIAVGNQKLMASLGIECAQSELLGTAVHVAIDDCYAGYIVVSDKIKPTSAKAISELKKCGVKKAVMLTGDKKEIAEKVSEAIGIDSVFSELLPNDKVQITEGLLEECRGKLAFVGDGINDAPVLSRADIGIAMGALGSDAAIEAADIVLMDDNPLKLSLAIKISKKCINIVYSNIVFAIGIKFFTLILIAFGAANMWLAIFADVGVAVLAILNAMRALFVKRL